MFERLDRYRWSWLTWSTLSAVGEAQVELLLEGGALGGAWSAAGRVMKPGMLAGLWEWWEGWSFEQDGWGIDVSKGRQRCGGEGGVLSSLSEASN